MNIRYVCSVPGCSLHWSVQEFALVNIRLSLHKCAEEQLWKWQKRLLRCTFPVRLIMYNPPPMMRMIVMTILCACACLRCINPVVQHTSFLPSIPHVKSYYKSRLPEAKCQYMQNVTCRCPHVFDTSFIFWVSHRDSLCITATSFNLNRSANWQL